MKKVSRRRVGKKAGKKAVKKTPKLRSTNSTRGYPFEVINSPIHGRGVKATAPIKEGTRLIEYVGERITNAEADRRYPFDESENQHTFLFSVNKKTIIDAAHGGNASRWINHSCDPNCEAIIERGRVFIEAIRDIEPGEELGYDYWFVLDEPHNKKNKELYACRCGSKNCRGTLLADKRAAKEYLSH